MKRKSLGLESLEQRTVLSASAVVAVENIAAEAPEVKAAPEIVQPETQGGVANVRMMTGDFNMDGLIDATDIDMLCDSMHAPAHDALFDLNIDGAVDKGDMDMLVREIIGTEYGDGNLDGQINSIDAAMMFLNLFTETSGWASGDFSCDGAIDGNDFILWNQFKFTETTLGTGTPAPAVGQPALEQTIDVAPQKTTPEVRVPVTTAPNVSDTVIAQTAVADRPYAHEQVTEKVTPSNDNVAEPSTMRLRFARLRRGFR